MHDLLHIITGTFTTRPYVFAFFAVYLIAAFSHLGWKKVAVFTCIGYLIAFLSEFCSINTGFPYGWYYYIETTRNNELWIAGVPFFDSLSYVFLSYCSYTMALFALSPLKRIKRHLVILETFKLRRSFAALFLGSIFQTYLDIIIDPVALQGSRWFLGSIYGYRETGAHFGVPLTNYLGWWLVSGLMILMLQRIDRFSSLSRKTRDPFSSIPFIQLLGPILYLSVILFNLTMALVIGEKQMAITGIFISFLPGVLIITLASRRINKYRRDELSDHLRDFPLSPAGG